MTRPKVVTDTPETAASAADGLPPAPDESPASSRSSSPWQRGRARQVPDATLPRTSGPRPTRSAPAAVSHLSIALCLAGLGLIAGVTWMYVVASIFIVGIVAGITRAITAAARTSLTIVEAPAVAIAGEDVVLTVRTKAPHAVVFELKDADHTIARWRQPAGQRCGQLAVRFASRGVVRQLDVVIQSAGPFGTWVWQRHDLATMTAPIAVGPAAIESNPIPTSIINGDGSGHTERRGTEPGAVLGLRPWADGDPIGWVHWPSAARGRQVLVRQWQPPARHTAEVEVPRHNDAALADAAASAAAGQIDAALRSSAEVRVTTPTLGGGSVTTTVRDRWAGAKALAHADLPRSSRPPEGMKASPIETNSAAQISVSAVAMVACATIASSTARPAFTWFVTLLVVPMLTLLRAMGGRRKHLVMNATAVIVAGAALVRFCQAVAAAGPRAVFSIGAGLVEILAALVAIRASSGSERSVLRFSLGASAALMGFSAALRFDPYFAWSVSAWITAVAVAFVALHRSESLARCTSTVSHAPSTTPQRARGAARTLAGAALVVAVAFLALIAVPIPEGPVRVISPSKVPEFLEVPADGGLAARDANGNIIESTADNPVPSAAFGYSAFTASFDLSQRGRPGNEVVMRVRAPAPDFWRAQTFETFDGRRWIVSPDPGRPQRGPVTLVPPRLGDSRTAPTDELVQTYMLEQDMTNLIFAASRPTQVLIDADVWVRPDGALRANTVLSAGTEYTVVSERVAVTGELLRMQAGPEDPQRGGAWAAPGSERYLQLPDTMTDRVRELTWAITDPYPNVYDKVLAIERWLRQNVEYDLRAPIPPEGWDAVDHFLFESQRGFCEQIATTLVIMLRSIGVPARVAAGYVPGERDPFAGVWVVREGDAHAWAEVWFPATGWQSFDPTAVVPFAGDTAGLRSVGFPIVAAAARFIGRWLPPALLALVCALVVFGAARAIRLAVRSRRDPAWAAQRRFEQLCRRSDIAVRPSDSNEYLAAQLALREPQAAPQAMTAATALDAAAFGCGAPVTAARAVAELARALPALARQVHATSQPTVTAETVPSAH